MSTPASTRNAYHHVRLPPNPCAQPIGGGNDGTCGALSVCGTFASVIFYADDMGLRAKHGFAQYNRQDLFGGAYGLVNSPTGRMALALEDAVVIRPDFWVSWLMKRTLGLSVLNATSSSRMLRAYAFAGAPPSLFASEHCGGVALLLINLDNGTAPTAVALPAVAGASSFAAWSLAPSASGGAFGEDATLNGALLPTDVDVSKGDPRLFLQRIVQAPVAGKVGDGAQLPPLSATFLCYGA